ncbi:MAG: response regulator [Halobacteriovoraceae bacterium]|nr:response regulator [Halobacteriovoraceae bacterium]
MTQQKKNKILIVDDEVQLLDLLKMEFEDEGFEVRIAENVDDAVVHLSQFTPEIVLSDLKMPVKSGKVLCDYVKENHPEIQFIFMSGYVEGDDSEIKDGTHFFQKPFSLQSVVSQVKANLLEEK